MPSYDLLEEPPVRVPKYDLLDEEPAPVQSKSRYDLLDETPSEPAAPISEHDRLLRNVGGQENYDSLLAQHDAENFAQSPSEEAPEEKPLSPVANFLDKATDPVGSTELPTSQENIGGEKSDMGAVDLAKHFALDPNIDLSLLHVDQQQGIVKQLGAAALNSATSLAESMTSPLGIASLALPEAPVLVQRLAALGFGATMAKSGVEGIVSAKTLQQGAEATIGTILGALALGHAGSRIISPSAARALSEMPDTEFYKLAGSKAFNDALDEPSRKLFSDEVERRSKAKEKEEAKNTPEKITALLDELDRKPGTPLREAADAAELAPNAAEAARQAADVQDALAAEIKRKQAEAPKEPVKEEEPAKEPEKVAPEVSPVRQILDSAIEHHAEELAALGHPKELGAGKDETGAGLFVDHSTGQIHVDEARLEQQTAQLTPEARETAIRRLVAEEVFHSATVKFAQESPENRQKVLDLLKDKELVDRTREAYGETFDSKDDFAKASEAARVLAQGKEGLTEASYKFLKDMLAWLEQKVKNLTPETKELIQGIRAKMGVYEESVAKNEYRPPIPKKSLSDRLETAGVGNENFTDPQLIQVDGLTTKHADRIANDLGIGGDQNSPFWIAAKDELEIRARKYLKKNGSLEGFGWNAVEGTVKSEITGTRDWDEHVGNLELDAPLSEGADSLLDMLHKGRVEESALTPEQVKHLRSAEALLASEEGTFLAAIKDPEFIKTFDPIEAQIARIARAPNSTLKEAYTDRLEEMAAAQGDAESVIQDATKTLNDKTAQYGKDYTAKAGPRDTATKARPEAGPKAVEKTEAVGGPGAMGPQEASEMSAKGAEETTSLKRAVVDAEREERGAEPIPTPEREATEAVVQRAEDLRDKDSAAGPALVSRILNGDTAISRDEAALLLVERKRLQNEKKDWLERMGRGEDLTEGNRAVLAIEDQMERVDQAQRAAGSAWSDVGRMYQQALRADYTLEALKRKFKAARAGREKGSKDLTTEEVDRLRKQSEEIEKLQAEQERLQNELQDAETNADVHRLYEATINELGAQAAEKPSFGKEVLDIARKTVDRWKREAEGLDSEITRMLASESGGVGGVGGARGRGKRLGGAPIANGLVTNIAKVIRARVGEAVLTKAEMLAELVDRFGEKIRPLFNKSWDEAHRLIKEDAHTDTVKEAVKATAQKNTDAEAPKKVAARAKAEAVSGEGLTQKTVADYVEALIKSGVHGEDAVMKAAHEGLSKIFPDISERDVRRAYGDYGKVKFPSTDAVKVEMSEIRRLVQLQESIERETAGLPALKTGQQRAKATQSIREKTKQLNELLKKRKSEPSPEQLASTEEAKITALTNRIADLDKELKTGVRQPKSEALPDSDAVQTLKAERNAMQAKLDEIRAPEKKSPVQKQLEQLERSKERIDKELAGTSPKKTPGVFKALSQRAEDLKAEIQAMQDLQKELSAEDRYNATRMKAVEARMQELDERLKTRNFAPKPKNVAPAKREALRAKEEELGRKKLEVDREAEKERLKNRGWTEKLLDRVAEWNRAFILSGPSTVVKLASAATEIVGIAPIEQAIGGGISKLAPKLAAKAERHGGFSPTVEAKAIAATVKNLFKDFTDEIKTGQMDIDVAHGKPQKAPVHLSDFIAHVHGALKSPARRNEFTRSFEKRLTSAARNGEDVSDPLVQSRLMAAAYKDANSSIFLEDNMVVDAYKRALKRFEEPNKENGHPSLRGKLAATGLKYTLPVVRIPTNIVSRVFEYTFGHSAAGIRFLREAKNNRVDGESIVKSLSQAVERMSPEQADTIMRNLKRGSLGTALLLLGYFNADNVGGYYQRGDKRDKDEAQFGGLRISGYNIPRLLVHNPALEQLQIGATVRRYVDSVLNEGGNKATGIASGAMAAGLGILDETPFTSELMSSARSLESLKGKSPLDAASELAGKQAENLVPQALQQPAKALDKDAEGNPIKRQPDGVVQHIESVVPGLRSKVPEKQEKPDYEQLAKSLEKKDFAAAQKSIDHLQTLTGKTRREINSSFKEHVKRSAMSDAKKTSVLEKFQSL